MENNENQQKQDGVELSDEVLAAAGLTKKIAYIKGKPKTGNAKRVEKCREKQAEAGVKQMNVVTTDAARDTIKLIADRTRAGENLAQVLASLTPEKPEPQPTERVVDTIKTISVAAPLNGEQKRLIALGERFDRTGGIRGILIAWLLCR